MNSRLLLEWPAAWFSHDCYVEFTRFFLDPGAAILTLATHERIEFWDVEKAEPIGQRSHRGQTFVGGFYRPGQPYAFAWVEGSKVLTLLSPKNFKRVGSISLGGGICAACWSACHRWLAVARFDGQILRWHVESKRLEAVGRHPWPPEFLAFSPDSRYLVASTLYSLGLWEMEPMRRVPLPEDFTPQDQTHYSLVHVGYPPPHFRADSGELICGWERSRHWRVEPSTAASELESGEFHTAMEGDYWIKSPHPTVENLREWSLTSLAPVGGLSSVRFPLDCLFAGLTHDQRWLVLANRDEIFRLAPAELFREAPDSSGLPPWELVARQLREGSLALDDAYDLLEDQERLLRWFAVECALQSTLLRHPMADRRAIVETCYRFALDSLSFRYDEQKSAFAEFQQRLWERSQVEVDEWSMVFFANKAKNAARRTRDLNLQGTRSPEWRRQRLAYLCEAWAICGERTPFLLLEETCPMDEPEEAKFTHDTD